MAEEGAAGPGRRAPPFTLDAVSEPPESAAAAFPAAAEMRLSRTRLTAVVLVAVVLVAASAWTVRRSVGPTPPRPAVPWFAPYVDATLTPTYQFQLPAEDPARQTVLGFVVASRAAACTPSWGDYYSLGQAATTLALDARIAQVRGNGGTPIVSFGGQRNTGLAEACHDPAALRAAYAQVIRRYHLSVVDFDVEGTAVSDTAATQRRARALASLQSAARAAHRRLAVWLTVPVARTGWTPAVTDLVRTTLRAGVDLAGVNVMAMDFGPPIADQEAAVQQAVGAAAGQLSRVYRQVGIRLDANQVWARLGVTVMIGQNDSAGEAFTTADARRLAAFATRKHLARVSAWSLNRDRQCGSEFPVVGAHSDTCSGVAQSTLQFSHILAGLRGSAARSAGPTPAPYVPSAVENPATSPFPIWNATAAYAAGYKVVREGYIYQAKWYNQGSDPAAAQTQNPWQTPWELIGPVLPGQHAPKPPTLAAGTYPAWSPTVAYQAGAEVLRDGLPYVAKWYTKGDDPLAAADGSVSSPWRAAYTLPGEPAAG